jgi:hypothetical protein
LSSRLLSRNIKVKIKKNHNSTSYFAWVWNLVSYIKGRAQTQDVREEGAEENIWTYER